MHDLLSALNGRVFESSLGYRLMQAPFAQRKLAPVLADADAARARRALDVGCGPGTNTLHFEQTEYLGVDLSEAYVRSAPTNALRAVRPARDSRLKPHGVSFVSSPVV